MTKWFLTSAMLLVLTVTAQVSRALADDFDRYMDCSDAASRRADAKHCDAYKESIACLEKAVQAAIKVVSAFKTVKTARQIALGNKAIAETKQALVEQRLAQHAHGCDVSSSVTPPPLYPGGPILSGVAGSPTKYLFAQPSTVYPPSASSPAPLDSPLGGGKSGYSETLGGGKSGR